MKFQDGEFVQTAKEKELASKATLCNLGVETKKTRSICPLCNEKLKSGDKSIEFVTDKYYSRWIFRKHHLTCWLSTQEAKISTKEMREAKVKKILGSV